MCNRRNTHSTSSQNAVALRAFPDIPRNATHRTDYASHLGTYGYPSAKGILRLSGTFDEATYRGLARRVEEWFGRSAGLPLTVFIEDPSPSDYVTLRTILYVERRLPE